MDVFPNPASGIGNIRLITSSSGYVTVELYNIAGIKVDGFFNEYISAGIFEASFKTNLYQKGFYILQIRNKQQI